LCVSSNIVKLATSWRYRQVSHLVQMFGGDHKGKRSLTRPNCGC